MATNKKLSGVRFTDQGKKLLEALAEHMGISQTAVLETLIRDRAKLEGVTAQDAPEKEPATA
jgi:hypothetical protein